MGAMTSQFGDLSDKYFNPTTKVSGISFIVEHGDERSRTDKMLFNEVGSWY